MEDFIRTASSTAGRAIVSAVPMVFGAAVAEPALLGAMAGAGILAAGVVLAVGVVWVAQARRFR